MDKQATQGDLVGSLMSVIGREANYKLQNSRYIDTKISTQLTKLIRLSQIINSIWQFSQPLLSFKRTFLTCLTQFLHALSPSPSFICCRNLWRVTGHIQINKWHIIRYRKRICGIHKQGRFHRIRLWRINYRVRIFRSACTRRWETGELYVIQLVSKNMFVSSYRLHLRTSWHKGSWPILPGSLIALIVVVKNVIMVSRCKLQNGNMIISMYRVKPKKKKERRNEKRKRHACPREAMSNVDFISIIEARFGQTLWQSMWNTFKRWESERMKCLHLTTLRLIPHHKK